MKKGHQPFFSFYVIVGTIIDGSVFVLEFKYYKHPLRSPLSLGITSLELGAVTTLWILSEGSRGSV